MIFNEEQARYYARLGCKKCQGKGFLEYSLPYRIRYCLCVLKRMKDDERRQETLGDSS